MSNRNSQASKQAARERIRAERERQKKRDRLRRQLMVGGSVVAVLVVAGGIVFGVMKANEPTGWEAAKDARLVKPANTQGKDGTALVIGKPNAKKTLEIYEDPRCPTCAAFEQASGETAIKDIEKGKYKASFVLASFIDDRAGGVGSKNAVSALGAALDVSPEAFLHYKAALYSQKNHPAENDDKFADDAYLIKVAQGVEDLKGNKEFEKAVKDGTYDKWALKMGQKFQDSGVGGTPSFKMDGRKLSVKGAPEGTPIISPQQFTTAVDEALKQ